MDAEVIGGCEVRHFDCEALETSELGGLLEICNSLKE